MRSTPSDLRRLAWRAVAALPRPVREVATLPVRRRGEAELRALTPMGYAERRLYLGPLNTAGQAREWARAAQTHLPGTLAQNLWAQRVADQAHFGYRADHEISLVGQRGRVREIHGARVLAEATHVLFESGRPVLADFHRGSMLDDVDALDAAGIRHAVLWHGSDIRDPRRHADRFTHSPFRDGWDDYLDLLQSQVERQRAALDTYLGRGGRCLVSTPDLLELMPSSTWLPLVVDVDRFVEAGTRGVLPLERDRPVVLHAPSNPRLKGGPGIEAAMVELDRRGLISYRRLQGVPHAQMPAAIADADIVLDQFALGAVGVFAAECLAAGRVVLAHLDDQVRARMTQADTMAGGPGETPPVVEASPETVGAVVERVVAERDRYCELARRGPGWSRRHHDGRRAAAVLGSSLLGVEPATPPSAS